MRQFIEIAKALFAAEQLNEAIEIPATNYGYWITPEGELIVVPYQSHEPILRELTDGEMQTKQIAFRSGWVRVVAGKVLDYLPAELIIQTYTGYIGARAMVALSALAKSQEFSEYTAEIGEDWQRFKDAQSFIAFVKAHRKLMPKPDGEFETSWKPEPIREEELNEAIEVPYTDYGYWIDPQGEIIRVPYQGHEKTLNRHTGGRLKTYMPAYREGWVRVIYLPTRVGSEGRRLIVESRLGYIGARTLSAIAAMARQPEVETLFAEIGSDWKEFTEAQPFVAFIRQHRRPLPPPEE